MPTIAEVAAVLSAVSQYGWPAIVLLTCVLLSRTRLCQELVWVISTEIRYQYLKRRGFTPKQLDAWVRHRERTSSKGSSTSAAIRPTRSSSTDADPDKKNNT